ncbi:hypothetical protein PISMIDRAFT_676508 [Pisolithus microcarpus 441]|uniref:Uncharacterized protein n=1 Tax=Pisolithus microcarpus 441 TaxID=765257 RepID=A0A0C9ZJ58_9AGAM|nr:hypothetical protein PISMIDRAFT_676508 [Pisolithus microcarpus 441]
MCRLRSPATLDTTDKVVKLEASFTLSRINYHTVGLYQVKTRSMIADATIKIISEGTVRLDEFRDTESSVPS